MTKQHPLVDYLTSDEVPIIHCYLNPKESVYLLDDMILAADWQLEQVIKWLQINLEKLDGSGRFVYEDDFYGAPFCAEKLLGDLKSAMRPRYQQEDTDEGKSAP